jgi:diguanylate cyclase (GGDEF)-like protein
MEGPRTVSVQSSETLPLAAPAEQLRVDAAEAETPLPPLSKARAKQGSLRLILKLGLMTITVVAIARAVAAAGGSPYHWLHSLLVPVCVAMVIGLFILRNEIRWARPTRHLGRLLGEIRDGDAPIEELGEIRGGVKALVPIIQQMLRDLKQQRAVVAQLNHEMRQKVANRTDALERQLGALRQQAARDGLTGLYNRRMFDTYLSQLVERCANNRIDLSVLMIDVDNFKLLNDTMGHSAGDDLLRDLGQIIRSGVRDQDVPFRVGGDEFVVVLPGAGPDAAQSMSRRLVEMTDALVKPLRLPRLPRLSIGIASLSDAPHDPSMQQLLQRADRQLYEVKAAHRRDDAVKPGAPLAKSA